MIPPLLEKINTGPWVAAYSLAALSKKIAAGERVVLPVCSLGTPAEDIAALAADGALLLPPLYHEALGNDPGLKPEIVAQVRRCFPFLEGTKARGRCTRTVAVSEMAPWARTKPAARPRVLAIGVDTTVEQHGPHLPLATDTVQTYAVLRKLAEEDDAIVVGPALDYGHLTWGLAFGMSIDLTPAVLARYARGFVDALVTWLEPEALYVADVHGSAVHRETVQRALRGSACRRWAFRWLHDPLTDFGVARGDMHAGGVETALVAHIERRLVDAAWWPARAGELARNEMTVEEAATLSADVGEFAARAEAHGWNGIVGRIGHAASLDGAELLQRMLAVARDDVNGLRH